VLPKLTRYKEDTSEYKVNRYQLPAELREAITAEVINCYVYITVAAKFHVETCRRLRHNDEQ
jgi:hypothetical protein